MGRDLVAPHAQKVAVSRLLHTECAAGGRAYFRLIQTDFVCVYVSME